MLWESCQSLGAMSRVESPLGPLLLGLSASAASSLLWNSVPRCSVPTVKELILVLMAPGTLPTKSLSNMMELASGIPLNTADSAT